MNRTDLMADVVTALGCGLLIGYMLARSVHDNPLYLAVVLPLIVAGFAIVRYPLHGRR